MTADSRDTPLSKAEAIVSRYRARGFVLPIEHVREDDYSQVAETWLIICVLKFCIECKQTTQDAQRLRYWRTLVEKDKASGEVLAAITVRGNLSTRMISFNVF